MNLNQFSQQIEQVHQRTVSLQNSVGSNCQQDDLIEKAFEELRTALEELHVAEEEIRQQNQELVIARFLVEKERQRYQELFDFAPDGYLVTDTDGKILEANRAAANLLQVSKNYLIGKPLINFIPKEERQTFRHQLLSLYNRERIQEWEFTLQPNKGNIFYCNISISTIYNSEDEPVGWRWLVRDITSRKQAEEELRLIENQNLQLEEATKIKTQFLAHVSHELRTPMNAILGFSQLLLLKHHHQLVPDSRNMVQRIINSGKELLKLIEDILDLSRIEAKKIELKPQEFNLSELITVTTEELRPLADQKNLTLVVKVNNHNIKIFNDYHRLRQVFVNLLSNAIKFTDNGEVVVELQQLEQYQVALVVKDTGIGIAQPDLQNIFQEFWQVNQTTTRKHSGTGLGLAITKQLVELMNGTITVESKLGEGSTFRVMFPNTLEAISH
jgi:PAS domain S-box-containing protein